MSGPHLKPYNDPPTCDSGSMDSPLEDSAHTTSAHLESPLEDSGHLEFPLEDSILLTWILLNYTPLMMRTPDFAQLDTACVDSHHDSIHPPNQSQDCLSPTAYNGTSGLFQPDESFIDHDEKWLPAPMLSLSQMISETPQPQFCSTPKRPRSRTPTVQGEIKKRRILSLATHQMTSRLSSRVTPLQTPSLKLSETPRVAPLKTPRFTPLKLIKTPRVKTPRLKTPPLKLIQTPRGSPLKSIENSPLKSSETPHGAPLKLIETPLQKSSETPRITPSFEPTHQKGHHT